MPDVLVAGAIANKYLNGGEAWVRLSWVRGLARLGCRVHFLEQIDPAMYTDAARAYFERVIEQFGLGGTAALLPAGTGESAGLSRAQVLDLAAEADLLVNISGHTDDPEILRRVRRRAYVDLDPGFTQFWQAQGNRGARLEGHDVYFTVGENIGRPECAIPTAGFDWRPLPPPVVLDDWPASAIEPGSAFTTVGAWRGAFGPVVHDGHTYGLKVHEFRKVIELPRRVPEEAFEIALEIHPGDAKDRDTLLANGWRLVDPREVAAGPVEFRSYVRGSAAEFSVAQGIYVETKSGWFSDRTVRYLAAGRPAVVQDTGFSARYRTGEGLVPFASLDDAAAGAARVASDWSAHSAAARAIAEEHFDSDKVLSRFLDEALP